MTQEPLATAQRKRKPCASCFTISEMLKGTMKQAKADSIAVMLPREVLEHIYTMAKKGAK